MLRAITFIMMGALICPTIGCDGEKSSSEPAPATDSGRMSDSMPPDSGVLPTDVGPMDRGMAAADGGDANVAADSGTAPDADGTTDGGAAADAAVATDLGNPLGDAAMAGDGAMVGDKAPAPMVDAEVIAVDGNMAVLDAGMAVEADAAVGPPVELPPGYTMRCPPANQAPNANLDNELLVRDICVVHRPLGLPFIGGVVENIGQQMICGVYVAGLTVTLENQVEVGPMLITARGLVMVNERGTTQNTCLAPGGSAPFMQTLRFQNDDDAASPVTGVRFSLRGAPAQVEQPSSELQIVQLEPEAMGENRIRFNGTVQNVGPTPGYTAAFFVTVYGVDDRLRIYDYNHASGVLIGQAIGPDERFEFRTWILGTGVDFVDDYRTILNWTDSAPD